MEHRDTDRGGAQNQGEASRGLEPLPQQSSLSRIWCAFDQPRGVLSFCRFVFAFLVMMGIDCDKYAVMAELLGRAGHVGSESVNCSAPDTGNMGKTSFLFHVSEWLSQPLQRCSQSTETRSSKNGGSFRS